MVSRIYVEKKPGFDVEAQQLKGELTEILGIKGIEALRIINRYDVEGIDEELFRSCVPTVFSEPQVDVTYDELPASDGAVFAVEFLPGQFDQRADSASECVQLISQGERPLVRSARVYLLEGSLTEEQVAEIKKYVINPVEAREASLDTRDTLKMEFAVPTAVETLNGFCALDDAALENFRNEKGLAMDHADIVFCQNYFKSEQRDPTITEIRLIDTYWSDHCRHTTFGTILNDVKIDDEVVQAAFDRYMALRAETGRDKKNRTLMDCATIAAKALKQRGILKNLDESEEINACSVRIRPTIDGEEQDWLLMFKNETHNHPTEIEPFGGAATCIGGAIRDPLSGRSYVYQAMRISGAGDITQPLATTRPGKLPQQVISKTAAHGYSSYGNQIGLATTYVKEYFHPGFVAKRMELGAVVGAAPKSNVVREKPVAGDLVILLGGKTGRDGVGGATGSSKVQTVESVETAGAEVQKGNAIEERKIQRLFRNGDVTRLIKKSNDFGAGGVCVAIGELADGLEIDLNKVPLKYRGLNGTEIAISESQERMSVVVRPEDADAFIAACAKENIDAVVVATVTEKPNLVMTWNGQTIVDIERSFLDTNGVRVMVDAKVVDSQVAVPEVRTTSLENLEADTVKVLSDLNHASQKGLQTIFDSSVGRSTVNHPIGGRYQITPTESSVQKLPVQNGVTKTASVMAQGFNPYIAEWSPYHGAAYAVIEATARLVATGSRWSQARFSYQEYFQRMDKQAERFGQPVAALLGSIEAQIQLGLPSIGGKDSMSGTFEELTVPPALVAFGVTTADVDRKSVV